jgi:hypothetical protein
MKKTILLFFALASFFVQAQLAVGAAAPNFTMTDINGVTHNLYDYTSAGKTVVIKLSATWCGPCWTHHQAGHWSDLHYSYGPQASNQVVVLYFEVDNSTGMNHLNGTAPSNTLGNWIAGTSYPIIDNAAITSLYPTGGGIPRFYTICPNNTIASNSASTATAVRTAIQSTSATGCNTMLSTAIQNNASLKTNNSISCSNNGIGVSAVLRNQGANTITTANASIVSGGNVIATQDFTMSRNRWQSQTLTFNPVNIPNPALPTSVVINTINGAAPHHAPYVNKPFNLTVSDIATEYSNITIKINLDQYGSETSWFLRNSAGAVVAQNPTYANANASGVYPQPDINLNLPNDCYTFDIRDSFGDGMCCAYGAGGYEIHANGVLIPGLSGGAFGGGHVKAYQVNALSANEFQTNEITLYPNPATDNFTINSAKLVNVEILNMLGKVVKSVNNVDNSTAIDVSNLEAGVYFVKVLGENSTETIKLIKK